VLVHLPNWLGDLLMARPLLFALRAGWPGTRLLGVGPAGLLALPAGEGTLDGCVAWSRERGVRRAAARAARDWKPEVALVLPASFSSAWLAWRSGARVRVGYRGQGRSPFLTRALARGARGDRHLSEEFLELASGWGVAATPVPRLVPTPEGDRLALEARARAGLTTLPALVALAAGARLALCNDSGVAHVAAATGAPTLQVYGSASSAWTAARGPRVRVLHRAPVCSPCWRRTCRIGTRCLDAVSVAWVLEQADLLLAGAA
jgi:heptosyltransferase-2